MFTAANVKHLPKTWSDHHPILLERLNGRHASRYKGFRFLEPWLKHAEFGDVVQRYWKQNSGELADIMQAAKEGFQLWNAQEFGNIFQRKKQCNARILGIQKHLAVSLSRSLEKLERKLILELDNILDQEESYWKQKARYQWITQGERNTRFFHANVVARRRRNRILQLKGADGQWCSDEATLKKQAYDYYKRFVL